MRVRRSIRSACCGKNKGNLTSAEDTFLHNCLYELRMAYVKSRMRWHARRACSVRALSDDEGNADRAGQRHLDGRADD